MYVDEEVRGFVLSLIKETMRFAVDVTAVVVVRTGLLCRLTLS